MIKFNNKDFRYSVVRPNDSEPDSFIKITGLSKNGLSKLRKNNWHLVIPDEIEGLPVTHIWDRAFKDRGIEKLTLSKNTVFIDDRAFMDNYIEEIEFPETVKHLGEQAFAFNGVKEVIDLPSKCFIGTGAFMSPEEKIYTVKDHELDFDVLDDEYDYEDGVIIYGLTDIGRENVIKRRAIAIPDKIKGSSVKTISYGAFKDLDLEYVELPKYLESIYQAAFRNNKLDEVSLPKTIKSVDISAFENDDNNEVTLIFNRSEELKW